MADPDKDRVLKKTITIKRRTLYKIDIYGQLVPSKQY
jgi:hypothetical protein